MGRVAVLHHNHQTPMKSRHRLNSNPNSTNPSSKPPDFTLPDNRNQKPPNRIPKKRDTAAAVATKPPAITVAKNLGVGQVKILKRGETLENCAINLKKEHDRKINPKIEESKTDRSVYSTRRLGPNAEKVSKQMKKVTECFAGFVFYDSPPPSSLPLPGFSRKNYVSN